MKFVAIASAKGLDIDKPVYTLDSEGVYGFGKLIKEEKTSKGIVRTFDMATFSDRDDIIEQQVNITHVAVIKNKPE